MSRRSSGELVDTQLTELQQSLDLDHVYVKGELSEPHPAQDRGTIRILSWNIERGHKPTQIAETIARIRPDVACLQEVDWGNQRTGSVDVLQHVAQQTRMLGLYAIEFLEVNSPLRPAKLAGGGATGNAVLTRFTPVTAFRIELPACLNWQPGADLSDLPSAVERRIQRERRIGQRCAIGVELRVGQLKLVVSSVHLEDKFGGVSGRWSQYVAAVQSVEVSRGTTGIGVIAGDFNTFDSRLARLFTSDNNASALGKPTHVPEAAWWQSALMPATGYVDPFPPTAWTLRIPPLFRAKLDWITHRGGTVLDYGIGPRTGSDHRPIWIDLAVDTS
jgi:endonuclease/exonuclease/phosphatase family metal-dependent hydrolase